MFDSADDAGPTILPDDKVPVIGRARGEPQNRPSSWPKIEGFRLEKLIGEGSEGRVYRAVVTLSNHPVAVKVLKGSRAASPAAEARFRRQIELASKLEHPDIVRIYQCDTEPYYFFSMELVDGVPFDKFVDNNKLDRRQTLQLFLNVCQAVSYAHHSLVVHLDLKPTNILVDKTGKPHVLDFGLAMKLSLQGGWEYTDTEGTPAYMSPEQARGELALNNAVASDTYALGVILYKALTGKFPRDTKGSHSEVMRRVADTPIKPPREASPRLPRELAAILERALAADPHRRYESVGLFAQDVDNYLQGRPLKAVKNTTPYILRKWHWRHRYGLISAVAVVAALASMAIWSYVNVAHERDVAESRGASLLVSQREAESRGTRLLVSQHAAELSRAELLVSHGDLLGEAGKWEQAKESYRQAHELFARENEPATAADLGTWNAFRHAPPPLAVIRGEGGIMDVALTPDGHQAVTVSQNGQLRLWGPPSGQWTGPAIEAHRQMILSVSIASDAGLALTGSADSTAKLIDLKTRKIIATLHPGDGWVTRVALSSDGSRALTVAMPKGDGLISDADNELTTWGLPDGKLQSASRSNGQVVCAAFSPDGSVVATGGRELAFWDGSTLGKLPSPAGGGSVLSIAFSSDGKQLASGGSDSFLRVWDVATRQQVLAVRTASAVNAVAFSHDGRTILSTGNNGVSQRWSRSTGAELASLILAGGGAAATSNPTALASVFCPDGSLVARVAADSTVSVWNTAAPVEVRRIATTDYPINDVYLLFNGRVVLASSSRGLELWDEPTGEQLEEPASAPIGSVDAIAPSANGARLAIVSGNKLLILDVPTWTIVQSADLGRRGNSPAILAFSSDGSTLVCSGPRFNLSVRSAHDLKEIGQLIGHTAPVATAVFSPDSKRILSGGRDGVVRLWDAGTTKLIRPMPGHLDAVDAVVFSPDGRVAYSAGGNSDVEAGNADFAVRQWDVASGQCLATFTGSQARVRALAISSTGSILAAASDDKTLKLWQTKDGRLLSTLAGHTAPVVAVRFAADGNSILSAGEDQKVLLWDLGAPRRLNDLKDRAGERFAFLGLDSWAADRLGADLAGGKAISHLTLARCFWKLGQTERAIAEMNLARAAGEAPTDYLTLCLRALGNRRTSRDRKEGEL
jgi:WD40 repeat protein/serine/threonine protein kinase